MSFPTQAQSFGDIRITGQGNFLTINQVIQIAVSEIKTRAYNKSSPYVGLRRFEEGNKHVFFGRNQLIKQLLQLVADKNLVLLAGSSGSGKSSVVRAGLLPQLNRQLPQGRFRALTITPDQNPFDSLRAMLQGAGVHQSKLGALKRETAHGIVDTLIAQRPADELWLIFIDQFEEVFNLCTDAERRAAFLAGLTLLAQHPQTEIKIVLAMRADFFDRFGPHPEFSKQAEVGLCLSVDMQASELRAAIEQPAAHHGVVFEENLVDQIIADVLGRPGALPLLQYTLDLLWKADRPADDRTLNAATYHGLGGIEGALRQRADSLYRYADAVNQLERPAAQKELLRQIFLHLVDLTTPGTEARPISKRIELGVFARAEERQLITELTNEKLLVSNNVAHKENAGPVGRIGTIEIAHEALLSAWPQLKAWIEQAREVIYVRNRLASDAQRYLEINKDAEQSQEELWGGTRLAQALELRDRGDFDTVLGGLLPAEAAFLEQSLQHREQRAREEQERQAQLRRFGYASGVSVANQDLECGNITQMARRLERLKPTQATADQRGFEWYYLWKQLHGDLWTLPSQCTFVPAGGVMVPPVLFSPDGDFLFVSDPEAHVQRWNVRRREPGSSYRKPDLGLSAFALSPDGKTLAVGGFPDGFIQTYDVETGQELQKYSPFSENGLLTVLLKIVFTIDGNKLIVIAQPWSGSRDLTFYHPVYRSRRTIILDLRSGAVTGGAAFNGSGVCIAKTSGMIALFDQGMIRLLNAQTLEQECELSADGGVIHACAFFHDGQTLVTGGDRVRVWDVPKRQLYATFSASAEPVHALALAADGRLLATAHGDHSVRLWDMESQNERGVLRGHHEDVVDLSFAPDGSTLATASRDRTVKLWDIPSHTRRIDARGNHMVFSLDGRMLASWDEGAADGRVVVASMTNNVVTVRDTRTGALIGQFGQADAVSAPRGLLGPDGKTIITWTSYRLHVWNLATGSLRRQYRLKGEPIRGVLLAREAGLLALLKSQTITLLQPIDGKELGTVRGQEPAALSGDGQTLAFMDLDGTLAIWDTSPLTQRCTLQLSRRDRFNRDRLEFSHDCTRLAHRSADGNLLLWDTKTWREITNCNVSTSEFATALAFSPDSKLLATSTIDGMVTLFETENGQEQATLQGHRGDVLNIAFAPRDTIATGGIDGTVRLWNVHTGQLTLTFSPKLGRSTALAFSGDGCTLAAGFFASNLRALKIWHAATPDEADVPDRAAAARRASVAPLLQEGERLAKLGKLAAATKKFILACAEDSTLRLSPEGEALRHFLLAHPVIKASEAMRTGFSYSRDGELVSARLHLTAALDVRQPRNRLSLEERLETLIERGAVCYRLNLSDQAAADWLAASSLQPKDARPYGNMGFILIDQGRHAEACAQFQKALAQLPSEEVRAEASAGLGIAHFLNGQRDEALSTFGQALEMEARYGDSTWLRQSRGWTDAPIRVVEGLLAMLSSEKPSLKTNATPT